MPFIIDDVRVEGLWLELYDAISGSVHEWNDEEGYLELKDGVSDEDWGGIREAFVKLFKEYNERNNSTVESRA